MVKMVKSPELQTQCNPCQIPVDFFGETDELILKFIQNCKGPRIVKTILKKKNKVGGLTYADFKAKMKQQKSRQYGDGTSIDI